MTEPGPDRLKEDFREFLEMPWWAKWPLGLLVAAFILYGLWLNVVQRGGS